MAASAPWETIASGFFPRHAPLGISGGNGTATVYGCDLTDGYVRINADYTT